jgi:peptidoglycan/xylan/chitin deacetylase (PgdA/CDA1 family)
MRAVHEMPLREKWLSFTFDDGFEQGGDAASKILEKFDYRGSFYVVTGWVDPATVAISDPYNMGSSHGNWSFWRALSNRGHEIGSHTNSHIKVGGTKNMLRPMLIRREMSDAYQTLRNQLGATAVVISMPWNASSWVSKVIARGYYVGCLAGSDRVEYNNLATLDRFSLKSWAPNCNQTDLTNQVIKAISGIPLGGWLIIQLHSLGIEGYEPIAAKQFHAICDFVAKREGVSVVTVRSGIRRGCASSPGIDPLR